jgi:PPOX class probable F420-dependent enzyme
MENFEHFRRANTILLATHRDGRTTHTPVKVVVDANGAAYFRISSAPGKMNRLGEFSDVRVAPCTCLGRPTGSDQPAESELLGVVDAERARSLFRRRFPVASGLGLSLAHHILRYNIDYYRLSAIEEPAAKTAE